MQPSTCPHLGALDAGDRRVSHVEFPSFENLCFAAGTPELIMLGDQATYCLGEGCTACPRFRSAAAANGGAAAAFVARFGSAEEAWELQGASGVLGVDAMAALAGAEQARAVRRRWAWVGASLMFAVALLCGSMVAAYTGWQWVSRNAAVELAGALQGVTTFAAAPTPMQPAVYLVMTATPLPGAAPAASAGDVVPPAVPVADSATPAAAVPAFPAAVTPTPLAVLPLTQPGAGADDAALSSPAAALTETPVVDLQLLVPTRRPTPVFDLPTSTPEAMAVAVPVPLATPTATPAPLGTPSVVFGPDQRELEAGKCTIVRWYVENVREVYYENLPMTGRGEREECIEEASETYTLVTILSNGAAQVYTTTVTYLAPTPTPTLTPSFTPVPQATPTWTPEPPAAPTPAGGSYAVSLNVNGSADVTCAAGQSCEAALLVTNGGSGADNLSIVVLDAGPFPVLLCRPDGVCGAGILLFSAVGPGNTAYLVARFTVPDGATAQSATYYFQAYSEGSGRTVASNPVVINLIVP